MTKEDEKINSNTGLQDVREFWIDLARTVVRESLSSTESSAQQIVTLVGVLIGVYSGAITISTIRTQKLELWLLILLVSPIVFWLISLVASLGVFWPNKYTINIQSATGAKEFMENLLRKKHYRLQISFIFLFAGIIVLIIALISYLLL